MSDATSLIGAEPESQGTQAQISEQSKGLIDALPKIADVQRITQLS